MPAPFINRMATVSKLGAEAGARGLAEHAGDETRNARYRRYRATPQKS